MLSRWFCQGIQGPGYNQIILLRAKVVLIYNCRMGRRRPFSVWQETSAPQVDCKKRGAGIVACLCARANSHWGRARTSEALYHGNFFFLRRVSLFPQKAHFSQTPRPQAPLSDPQAPGTHMTFQRFGYVMKRPARSGYAPPVC